MKYRYLAVSSIHEVLERQRTLRRQWEHMCVTGEIRTFRNEVSSSWSRCLSHKVDPLLKAAPMVLSNLNLQEEKNKHQQWLEIVYPHLDSLFSELENEDILILLSLANGVLIEGRANSTVWKKVEKIHGVPGANYSEGAAGTNAIGTAIAERKPTQILGAEHFCEGWHSWVCSAAPIRDPWTKELIGVLNISGEIDRLQAYGLPLVLQQANRIENELRNMALYYINKYFHDKIDFANNPVVIINKDMCVINMNDVARHTLNLREGLSLNRMLGCSFHNLNDFDCWGQPIEVTCESARQRTCVVTFHPYRMANRLLGGLVVFHPVKASSRSTDLAVASLHMTNIITQNDHMLCLIEKARKAAGSDMNVLLTGETGVGKEVFARFIHEASSRAREPFVAVNCGAIPRDLLASELFGYEPGAFTGAAGKGRPGKFVAADGGTVFLDEIGELPLEAQVYLLRVLEEKAVVPVGGTEPRFVDVRIIAATNRDLEEEVRQGRFRADLFYRLNVLCFRIPPLRDRREDIPLLVRHFLLEFHDSGVPLMIEENSMATLIRYDWPGNIRQLKNVVAQAVFNSEDRCIRIHDLPPELVGPTDKTIGRSSTDKKEHVAWSGYQKRVSRELLEQVLGMTGGNVSQAAKLLGVSRMTVYRKAKQYNLSV
ncbi:sigma-54-dependent Fis family transcriptional regulator [Kyrpidia spormannii]|uniref:GAF modulated sigma54 specific transcriptional regulator, Fis family n=2 Tax=Kyrpidia spormannii TaxID=2055160 RepID=A0A6F9ECA8_9BACL|nr:sigma-54-dependent Fis family transcriptional regulator [Kyrpidia spormannii]CAB3393199.1 GAF modulated sigma54 specific transcriptional regulator, Fis family [Kyrpidia spormannii]CAB3394122.1 GAF modulated sigma54 specific transcriptional regulator, Fis family [Kyrpidia spormannii]